MSCARPNTIPPPSPGAEPELLGSEGWAERVGGKWLLGWLLVGLALRLALLPLTVHPDLLGVYFRVDLWRQGMLELGDFHLQVLPMFLHRLWADLTGVGLPDLSNLPWPGTLEEIHRELTRVLEEPGAIWRVVVWKLPYALADVVSAALVLRLAPGAQGRSLVRTWLLHPLVLYVIVLFGKHESFMVLPLVAGLVSLREGRECRGFLLLGVAVAMRVYPAFVVLPMLLAASCEPRRRLELGASAAAPLAAVLVVSGWNTAWALPVVLLAFGLVAWLHARLRGGRAVTWLWGGLLVGLLLALGPLRPGSRGEGSGSTLDALAWHGSRLLDGRIELFGQDALFLFVLAFGAVCLWAHRLAGARAARGERPFDQRADDVADAGLVAALAFFGLNSVNPQYFLLFAALVVVRLHRGAELGHAHALQSIGILLYLTLFPGGTVTTRLFAPVAPQEILQLPGPADVLPASAAGMAWPALGRALLGVGCLWMTWELFATRRRRASAPSPCPAPGIGPSARSALALAFVAWPLALAFGLAAPLWGDVILRDPFTPVTWKFNAARALDGLVVEVGERPPVHVDLRPIAPRPRRPPEPARQRFWVSELDADAGQELVVAESEATPDATSGAIRIPLAGVTLRPGRTYAFSWGGRETNDPAGMEHRLGYAVPGAEVAARIGARFRARYFTDTSFGYVWLSVLAGLVAGGALCLAAARRSAPNL